MDSHHNHVGTSTSTIINLATRIPTPPVLEQCSSGSSWGRTIRAFFTETVPHFFRESVPAFFKNLFSRKIEPLSTQPPCQVSPQQHAPEGTDSESPSTGSSFEMLDASELVADQRKAQLQKMDVASFDEQAVSSCLADTSFSAVTNRRAAPLVRYMNPHGDFTVITLPDVPGIVIKIPENEDVLNERVQSRRHAEEVVAADHLDQLVIPESKVVTLYFGSQKKPVQVIVENRLPILKGNDEQKLQHYANHQAALGDAVEQMAVLICKTGLSVIKPSNLPLMVHPETSKCCFALVDLEVWPNSAVADGIFGPKQQYGEKAYGLMAHFPQHADRIAAAVRATLPESEVALIDTELNSAVEKAYQIEAWKYEVEFFHLHNGIAKGAPAIPESLTDEILARSRNLRASEATSLFPIEPIPSDREIIEVIATINAEVSAKEQGYDSTAHGREWRLTMSRSRNDLLYRNYEYIEHFLVPFLQEKGLVHSVINEKEAVALNVHVLREPKLGNHDRIVQF